MRYTICCVGRLKEKYWREAIEEYSKRISRYGRFQIVELDDEKAPERMSQAQALGLLEREGERLLKAIPEGAYVIALAINGNKMSSEKMAAMLAHKQVQGISHVAFVIGGSLGLSNAVLDRADLLLSFSDMTFPHQMMRVVLLEQIYRWIKIQKNEPYHK